MTVCLIGVDPGVTTGLAWGRFNPELRDRAGLWIALARGRGLGYDQIGGSRADIVTSGVDVSRRVHDLIADWNLSGFGTNDVWIFVEDFQVRKDLIGGTGRDKLAPVFITGLLMGSLAGIGWGQSVRLISASTAKRKASDDRLRYWARLARPKGSAGWVKGKQHARDAFRHLATGFDLHVV